MRRLGRLRLPPPEWCAALPLPRLQGGFHDHQRNALRLAQAPAPRLSRGHCDLLQRGQGQVGARPLARSWRVLQVRFRACAQAPRGDGGGIEGPHGRRRGQDRGSRWRLFRRLREARNLAENRVDRRLARNQTGKRKVVVIVRERNGNSVPAVFRTEGQAQSWIKARIAKGTVVNADEATSWDDLHGASK